MDMVLYSSCLYKIQGMHGCDGSGRLFDVYRCYDAKLSDLSEVSSIDLRTKHSVFFSCLIRFAQSDVRVCNLRQDEYCVASR